MRWHGICVTSSTSSRSTPAAHGDSDWPDSGYTFAQRVDDLEAFADAIGMRDAIAVAHSTGGIVRGEARGAQAGHLQQAYAA